MIAIKPPWIVTRPLPRFPMRNIGPYLCAALVAASLSIAPSQSAHGQIASRFVKVDNLPRGQVLWIRSGPGRGFERVGLLPYNARRIRNYGCKRRATGYWCEIRYRGQHGWASGRFLAEDRTRRT